MHIETCEASWLRMTDEHKIHFHEIRMNQGKIDP